MDNNVYSTSHHLNASECNAQRHISLALLVQRLIETATDHASMLGVGYNELRQHGLSWVLSRLTLEVEQFPTVDSLYRIDTWVESINRHFTERCFAIIDPETDRAYAYARTVWCAMDIASRTPGDMTDIMRHVECVKRECPVVRMSKIQAVTAPNLVRNHHFAYSDIDFNRHVNSTRYIEALLNEHTVEFYDTHRISRFEIAYMDEIHYAEDVEILRSTSTDGTDTYEIKKGGLSATRARLYYV